VLKFGRLIGGKINNDNEALTIFNNKTLNHEKYGLPLRFSPGF